MDGTLIDSEAVYMAGMQDAARTLGLDLPISILPRDDRRAPPRMQCACCSTISARTSTSRRSAATMRPASQERLRERVPVKPGVVELLDFLADRGLPLAIATSANRETAERNLGRAGLLDRFRVVVDARRRRARQAALPTSTSRPRAGSASRRPVASPSRIRASASSPPMPPACGGHDPRHAAADRGGARQVAAHRRGPARGAAA